MGRDPRPRRDRRTRRRTQARVRTRTCGLPHRAASPVRGRVRSGGGPLARGLPDRWRRGARPASPLSRDGVAGRGTAGRRTGWPHVGAALSQGCDGRAAVCQAARPVQQARPRVHGHDELVFRRRWRADTRSSWVLQGPSARPASDDPRRPARRRRGAGLHGDVAGQHRRHRQLGSGGRPAPKRFSIGRVCIVADRGMISAETIAELEARGLFYILGVRERSDKLVRDLVLDDPAPFVPLTITKRRKSVDYEAKAVTLAARRYIVCRNHDEAKKDAADRAAILAALERQLKKGDKALVGNTGYRRFLASTNEDGFAIDYAKAEEDAKFDGVFVLRTNTDLAPLDAMLCYKQLTMVEQTFRTAKSLFATRPIFHKVDETIRGHVSCSFLALVLKKELEERIADLGRKGSWPDILADLDSLTETKVEQDDKCFLLRSPPRPAASLALAAAGVALPPTVRQVNQA